MKKMALVVLAISISFSFFCNTLEAREFSFLGGAVENGYEIKPVIRLQYTFDMLKLSEKTSIISSLSAYRELDIEKPTKHHRDGFPVQAGFKYNFDEFSIAALVGIYPYYDTQKTSQIFGVAPVSTVLARYSIANGLFSELQFNAVLGTSNDTRSLLVGFGLDLDKLESKDKKFEIFENDLALYTNGSIFEVQYNRRLMDHLEFAVEYLHEFDEGPYGFITLLKISDRFFGNRVEGWIGGGALCNLQGNKMAVTGAVSVGGKYRFSEHFGIIWEWLRLIPEKQGHRDITSIGPYITF